MNKRELMQIGAAIVCLAVFACSISLMLPLLALNLERRGESSAVIGFLGTLTGLGILVGAPLTPRISGRFGANKTMIAALTLIAAGFALYKIFEESLTAWLLIRAFTAVAAAPVFVISEAAIITHAPVRRRGMVLGIYAVAFSLGFVIGPAIISLVGISGWAPYLAAVGLVFCALLVTATVGIDDLGEDRKKSGIAFSAVYRRAPLAFFCAFTVGCIEIACYDLLPVYARKLGLEVGDAALVLAVFSLGAMVLQVPLGMGVDKIGTRPSLAGFCLIGIAGAFLLPLLITSGAVGLLGLAVWSACILIFYPLGLNDVGRLFDKGELLAVNALFGVFYGLGASVGPTIAGIAMDISPLYGLVWVFAVIILLLLGYLSVDSLKNRASPP